MRQGPEKHFASRACTSRSIDARIQVRAVQRPSEVVAKFEAARGVLFGLALPSRLFALLVERSAGILSGSMKAPRQGRWRRNVTRPAPPLPPEASSFSTPFLQAAELKQRHLDRQPILAHPLRQLSGRLGGIAVFSTTARSTSSSWSSRSTRSRCRQTECHSADEERSRKRGGVLVPMPDTTFEA